MAGRQLLCPGCSTCLRVPDRATGAKKEPPRRGKRRAAWLAAGFGLAAALLLGLWLSLGTGSQRPGQGRSAAATTRPRELANESALWQAFGANDAAAHLELAGKRVQFLLRSAQVAQAEGGVYRLSASVNARAGRNDRPNVVCYLCADENVKAVRFPSDGAWRSRAYLVCGVCQGKQTSAGAFGGYCVTVDDCTVEGPFELNRIQKKWALDR
jgi:hypothetical protein